jgi:hypothetical protein
MAWRRNRDQTTRDYPAAGTNITGDTSRFRRAKTTSARQAGAAAEAWETSDRRRDKQGTSFWSWK